MDLTDQFKAICNDFPAFRNAIADSRQYAHEPQLRAQMDRVCQELDRAYADFQRAVPMGISELEKDIADSKRKMAEAERLIPEARQKIAEAEQTIAAAKVPELPVPGVPDLDPQHGSLLRRELIERYFATAARRPVKREGEVTEMEHHDWS